MSEVKSISAKLNRLVYLGWAMLLVVSIVAVWVTRVQSSQFRYLSSTITPAVEFNGEIFRNMTTAQTELRLYETSHDPELLTSYRAVQAHVIAVQVELRDKLMGLTKHGAADAVLHTDLLLRQEASVQQWWSYALSAGQTLAQGINVDISQSVTLFDDFRVVNSELDEHLKTELFQAQGASQKASRTGLTVIIVVAFAALIAALTMGRRLARTISLPIIDLRDAMSRHHDGELDARARENQGSEETRSLAHEFNAFMDHESELRQTQACALSMLNLTIKIENSIRGISDTQKSLEIMCAGLGEGLGVDRVMANTMYAGHDALLRAQWHLPGLPPVRDLPEELVPHIFALGKELWQSSGHLVSNDRLTPEAQTERAKIFYRHTNARAVVIVPIGIGDEAIGMIYVMTVHQPRQWADSEIDAVQRVAAFLARVVVEDTHRIQQREYVERLEQLEHQRTNFLATVSHELRTPLTSISGYLELLRDGYSGELTADQERMVAVMERNTMRLGALIEELLTRNSSQHVKLEIDIVGVSLCEMISNIGKQMSSFAQSYGIKLEVEAGPQVALVRGDAEQLRNAFVNIVSNAIKFSRRGSAVELTWSLDENTRLVRFTCRDSGIGIPFADQSRLFTRFFRASNTTDQAIPGIGLGLTFVKQIVEDHGGEVHVTSVEGKGTTVVIDLPWFTPVST